ncbi:metallophosphoesterase family protein [Umezakia ovalisporum]|uniref:Metallophosphoesterase n=1 Tax=Umezakia ovalisporum FSS-43 TaxID=2740520 RepID=A0ABT6K6I4_9CYAN|nr:metallophosphoesterase [Umezakia ovalisporum]MBI1243102.1 metallophosphoesterase [Nostoc sp. RI_552]MDH6057700.1 metallophosphoesterase [Umezakia ovalisporum FSS-43]MDH6067839.1 metallophosphoesterase [Umezakia ovalisporum APH033B]MDH6072277.1 metallophosphoesterase [Umezakia ovalisporum CobakiLakeA]MDH6074466.1 metallophosphoesterase [Umezakia ovalisporum CS-1034]
MKLVSDPAIAKKISKMQQRVKWQDPSIVERGIDQTRLVLADAHRENQDFSFLVVGDSGTKGHRGHNPQRQVAEQMLPHHQECSFMLHTGDVIYLVGSSEYYQQNFIEPYREFLLGGEHPEKINYDQMVFNFPILPVPGNHDYYDLPLVLSFLSLTTLPLRRLLRSQLELDVGLHGSGKGNAYAKAFLDYLKAFHFPGELGQHLDNYYTAQTDTGRCLNYQPGRFTRLPNRYYTFCYRGIDFFALDSNTFNEPIPIPTTQAGRKQRRVLEQRRQNFEREKLQIMETAAQLNPENPSEAEKLDDLQNQISQIEELIVDINKQLNTDQETVTDMEQLEWLKQRLIKSWHTPDVRGRVIYFHHPPYVTEATKWQQGQTLAVRDRLRRVLNEVATELGSLSQGRPLVNLVLNGHAHCLEHLQTLDTGHADSNIHWVVCGGSGYSLRRQRTEGGDLRETVGDISKLIARSHLFVGRHGHGSRKKRPYSSLRIDVTGDRHPQFILRPLVAEWYQRQWHNYEMPSFTI